VAKLPGAIQGARIVGKRHVRLQRRQNPDGRMPLFDHLRELRNRVVKMALALVAGMVVGLIFFKPVWNVTERIFLGAAIPLLLAGNLLAYLSLGRSMHFLPGLTPQHVSNLIQVGCQFERRGPLRAPGGVWSLVRRVNDLASDG
jgi:hypothetical protein